MTDLKHRKQAGFTLFEMIIVIFLMAVLLIGLLNIFDWQQKVYSLEQADIAATGTARIAMNHMTFAIAQGSEIVTNRNINGTDYTTGGTTLVLKLPAYDSGSNVLANAYDYIVYTVDDNRLLQVIDADSSSVRHSGTKLLTDSLENITFTYNNATPASASQVSVNLTTRAYYRGNHSVSVNLQETIFLRNR